MTTTPAKKTAASPKKDDPKVQDEAQDDTQDVGADGNEDVAEDNDKVSGHDRLDAIADSVGYDGPSTAIRELVEFVRETTPNSKLGKRSKQEDQL